MMSSRIQLPKEYRDAVQEVLHYAFKDTGLTPDDVESMRVEAKMKPFPRSPFCRCRRCISQYQEWSISYYNVTLETTSKGTLYGTLPGPKDAFAHPKETSQ